jgi:general secretion pathway protein K
MKWFKNLTRARGFALLVVLWVLTLLSLMAAALLRESGTETRVAQNLRENAKAEALAEAGLQRAMLGLLDHDDATVWRADGTSYSFPLGEGAATIQIQSEAGKIDINTASNDIIEALFIAGGISADQAPRLVEAVADFRDPDGIRRPGGAEDSDYRAMGVAHEAKDAPFEATEELMLVRGVTPDLYERLSPAITVYGRQQLDVTTAPSLVLQILRNVMPERLDRMVAVRRRSGARVSRPRTVTVTIEARTSGGGLFIREAIIQRTAGPEPFRVLTWRQRWSASASEQ